MERIQEAIEKARRERQGKIGRESEESKASGVAEDAADLNPGDEAMLASHTGDSSNTSEDLDLLLEQEFVEEEQDTPVSPAQTVSAQTGAASIRITYSDTKTIDVDERELKDRRIIAGFAHDSRSEPYRQLRGQILKKFRDNNWQTLAITSPNAGSGRTLTAINLAISLSLEANQTVLLVDLDLRNPGVAQSLGITEINKGLVDYINGGVELRDILINPGYERLVVLPGTPQGNFTSEILSSPEMQTVIDELVSRYPSRLIVFDLPAVLDHDDALMFSPRCDATLMVLEEGGSKQHDIERAYQLLEGCNIIGSVFNKVRYT